MTASKLLIYACSEGLDLLGQAFLLPWGFWYLVHAFSLEGHWGKAVISYGSLCAVQALGRFFGRLCSPMVVSTSDMTTRPQQVFGMLLLAGSVVVLCLTNRYALVLLAYFAAGFAGATLVASCSPSYPLIGGLCLGGDFDYALGSNSISHVGALRLAASASGMQSSALQGAAADIDGAGRNAVLIFTFVSLTSGLLYGEGHSGSVSRHSALWPCLVLAAICLLAAALYISTNRIAYKRMQWSCWLCCCCDPQEGRARLGSSVWALCAQLLARIPREEKEPQTKAQSSQWGGGGGGAGVGGGGGYSYSPAKDETRPLLHEPPPPVDPALVPACFLSAHSTAEAAAAAYAATLAWRRQHHVDVLMSTPQTDFFQILDMYPHAIHGRSLDGCFIVYEVLGQARPKELSAAGITPGRLVWHFILRNEYILRRLAAPRHASSSSGGSGSSSGGGGVDLEPFEQQHNMMTVLDVKGISVADITTDVMSFIRQSGEIMDTHYPAVVQRLVICNAPQWFYSVWTFLARVLPDSVRKKIVIIHDAQGLDKYIAPEQRPEAYGGTGRALGQADEHLGFLRLAEEWEREGHVIRREGGAGGAGEPVSQVSAAAMAAGVGAGVSAGAEPHTYSSSAPAPSFDPEAPSQRDADDAAEAEAEADAEAEAAAAAEGHSGGLGFGLVGWVRSRFAKAPTAAHLGERNRFHFDAASGTWALETAGGAEAATPNALDDDGGGGGDEEAPSSAFYLTPQKTRSGPARHAVSSHKMTPAQLEEHGLVLAIQAAHLASTIGRRGERGDPRLTADEAEGGYGPMGRGLVADAMPERSPSRDSHGELALHPAHGPAHPESRASAQVFLLVTALYVAACLAQAGLVAMLPVWLVIPAALGGEGYSVKDVTLVLSAAGLAALHAHIFLRPRIGRVAQASPLRALRTGAGSLALACFALPALRELIWLPSQSLLAIPLPAVLLVWAVWSANLARQSAGCLLGVVIRTTFASPGPLLNGLSAAGEVLGPLLSSLVVGHTLQYKLRYPMDAAFLFAVTSCLATLLYLGSLALHLQFRGDFGVMPDEARGAAGGGRAGARGGPSGVAYLLSLALGDLALLLGPVGRGSGFGTRLFNLKSSDLKDV